MVNNFKEGDSVYMISRDSTRRVHTLAEYNDPEYSLAIFTGCNIVASYTKEGMYYGYDNLPTLVHATEENQVMLSKPDNPNIILVPTQF